MLGADSSAHVTMPVNGNRHELLALEDCAFLDVLTPSYDITKGLYPWLLSESFQSAPSHQLFGNDYECILIFELERRDYLSDIHPRGGGGRNTAM